MEITGAYVVAFLHKFSTIFYFTNLPKIPYLRSQNWLKSANANPFLPLRGWVPAIFPIFFLFPIKFSSKYILYFQNSQKQIFGFFLKTAKFNTQAYILAFVLNLVIFSTFFLIFSTFSNHSKIFSI